MIRPMSLTLHGQPPGTLRSLNSRVQLVGVDMPVEEVCDGEQSCNDLALFWCKPGFGLMRVGFRAPYVRFHPPF